MELPTTSVTMLARLGSGDDPAAWSGFVALYGPRVVQWCRLNGLQDADAEDVAQEVLLQFSRQVGQFRYDASKSFRGWLRTVVNAAVVGWGKRRKKWNQGSGDSEILRRLEGIEAREELVARIEEQFDGELLEIAANRIRKRVEPHTWEAFRLLAFEGRPGKEVAEKLGMKLNTTFAARNKVQRLIREEIEKLDPGQ